MGGGEAAAGATVNTSNAAGRDQRASREQAQKDGEVVHLPSLLSLPLPDRFRSTLFNNNTKKKRMSRMRKEREAVVFTVLPFALLFPTVRLFGSLFIIRR